MKKLFVFAIMAMFTLATQAQIVSSRSSRITTTGSVGDYAVGNYDGWNTIYLQWNPSSLSPEVGSSESFTGFSVGFNHAFSLTQSIPLYVEAGIGIQYSFWDGDYYYLYEGEYFKLKDSKIKILSAKVPVSLMYKFDIPNSTISIVPNAGLDLRFNILGKLKNDQLEKSSYNLFDKDDMRSDDNTWNRFQIGWHVGVNFMFNNQFLVGASYGTDFSEIRKSYKIHTGSITLGYCF